MENSEKVVLFFSDIFSKDIRKKLPSVDVLHKPISWRREVRQACGILSMEVGATALRDSVENRGETQEKRSRKYDTYIQLQKSPQRQRWQIFATYDTFPHHVSWKTRLISYHTILIDPIHNL